MQDDDSPLSDDEEEMLVYVEFEGMSGLKTFCDEKLELDMIGLDSENPIMCVDGKYYEGNYEDAVGTYMFFEDIEPVIEDTVFDKTTSLKYYAKTRKILKMSRVFVKPRLEVLGDSNHSDCIPNMDTIKAAGVPPKYQEEALLHWEEMRNERLEALNEYLEKQRQREEKRQQGIELDSESDDDNPFAMYKPTVEESDEIPLRTNADNKSSEKPVKSDSDTLTIIDPGPSTSKDSVAWFDSSMADSSENLTKCKPTVDSENPGYIQIPERKKPNKGKKKIRKKKSENVPVAQTNEYALSDNSHDCVSNSQVSTTVNDELVGERMETEAESEGCATAIGNDTTENIDVSMNQVNDGVDNMIIDEIQSIPDENTLQGSEEIVAPKLETLDKKVEKQKRRAAKMKEISERLKVFAAEKNPKE